MNVDDLIGIVFMKKPLWDQRDLMHHNQYILDKLWVEVASSMNSTRQAVRGKWKAMRDKFCQEFQKKPVPHSGDSGGSQADWKSPWKHFDNLLFLQDQFTVRTAGGNLLEPEVPTDSLDTEPTEYPTVSNCEEVGAEHCPSDHSETPASQRKHKRPSDEVGHALIELEQRKLELFQLRSESSKETDEDMAFFESLLPHVKPLPQADKLLLRIKIQKLVYDFIMKRPTNARGNCEMQPIHYAQVACTSNEQFSHPHNPDHELSNPSSVASYFSNYSGEEPFISSPP